MGRVRPAETKDHYPGRVNGVQLLLIVGAGIAVSAIARRRGVEPGLVIVVLAAAASFLPEMPRLELEPELILAIVVPPLLYSATRGASFAAFGANLRSIYTLGITLVVLTAGALGVLTTWILPSIGAAAAFVLGSVLAPPDTITIVSHGDEIGLPKRITSILTGESLVNDATALTLFTIAVAAVNGEHTNIGRGVLTFLRTALVGLAIGGALAAATLWLRKRLGNPTLETSLVLLLPFTAFLAAEQAHASGILAVVAAAFLVSVNLTLDPRHQYPGAYRTRLQEDAFWPVLDFLLETFVFAYIGLQLRFVLADVRESEHLTRTLVASGVLLVAAIVIRMAGVYVLFGRWTLRWRLISRRGDRDAAFKAEFEKRRDRDRRRGKVVEPPTHKDIVLVGWTGMRGILTLAAAAAVPELTTDHRPFPGRSEIQAIALFLTLGTLLIQGTTVKGLARWLKFDLSADRSAEGEMREHGRQIVAEAAAEPAADIDESFDRQRTALGVAVHDNRLTEEIGRRLIEDIDLRQAARHTAETTAP
jgi:CPA1 family monovalent cation:H+ antiporter